MYKYILTLVAVVALLTTSNGLAFDKELTATWEQPSPNGVAGWTLSRGTTPGGPYEAVLDIPYDGDPEAVYSAVYTMTVDPAVLAYYFIIQAYDVHGRVSEPSNEALYLPNPPEAPVKLRIVIALEAPTTQ